jgi:hypothetical protein
MGRSQRSSKGGLLEYLCMCIPAVVSSGSLVRILYHRESYDSWENPKGPIRTVCQSTINVVVDAPASFCCHILMLMFQFDAVDDVVVPTSCY